MADRPSDLKFTKTHEWVRIDGDTVEKPRRILVDGFDTRVLQRTQGGGIGCVQM